MADPAMTGRRSPVGVLLIDDHRMLTEGLRLLLDGQPDMRVVGEARSLDAALAEQVDRDPDVILTELVLGPAHGAELVDALETRFPTAAVVVLTTVDDS